MHSNCKCLPLQGGRYLDLCDTVAQITEKWAFPHIYVWSGYIFTQNYLSNRFPHVCDKLI